MGVSDKIEEMEKRFIIASASAGIVELIIWSLKPHSVWGYFGTGLILYAIFHYVQLKRRKNRW